MSRTPVSIVIPCYNDGDYLKEAVASAKEQTYSPLEIVVVDDASSDTKTQRVLDEISKDTGIVVLRQPRNAGPAAARNLGIREAQGAYILPLDADDKIAPTYVQKAVEVLDTRSDIGIVYCEAMLFGEKNELWHLPPFSFPEILTGNTIFASAMFRRSDWEAVGGYDESMRSGNEDYEFWLKLIERSVGVYRIPETLFYYRTKPVSRTTALHDAKAKEVDTYMAIFDKHRDLYLKHIRVFFETIDRQRQALVEKDEEIRRLHRMLAEKNKTMSQLYRKLDEVGGQLSYARDIIRQRDEQLEAARLRNRLKRLLGAPFRTPPSYDTTEAIEPTESGYTYVPPKFDDTVKQNLASMGYKPLISIIMPVYNVDPKWLQKAIDSVKAQWYDRWELCIVDDKSTNEATREYLRTLDDSRIKVHFGEINKNIAGASNDAVRLATGEYLALLDNDDELTPDALYETVRAISDTGAEFVYSDEDFIDTQGVCSNPHFKPDFSPDLLLSHNYITHFSCFKRSLFEAVGGFDERFSGSQDYDLFLKLTEKTDKIHHIPKVLYHWRTIEGSTSADSQAKPEALKISKQVLEETLKRRGIEGHVEYGNIDHYFRVRYTIKDEPLVSIVIPFKDKPELLRMCIGSILEKTTYRNFEIIGISNNSESPDTFEAMKDLQAHDNRVRFYEYNIPFNYAAINNHAVDHYAEGEHIVLLNNDIEIITPEWIEAMLEHSQRSEIGCVGVKLYYPDDTIQHAGIVVGLGGYAGHSHKHYPRDSFGYFNRLHAIHNVSAVTAACMMVQRSIYDEMGGMNEEDFAVAYNDVDFCLRVMEKGYRNLMTPYAQMYHHESVSRGYETSPEKQARFEREKEALARRHHAILLHGDPYYNPNLTLDKEDYSLKPTIER